MLWLYSIFFISVKCICEKEFISKRTLFKHTMQFHHKVVKNEEVVCHNIQILFI